MTSHFRTVKDLVGSTRRRPNKKSRLMVSQEGRTWRPVVHPLTWEVIRLNEDGSISHYSYASTEAAAKEMVKIMDEAVHEGRE